MAQAHRIKTEAPAIRVGVLRFVNGLLREIGFWLLVAGALGMIAALVSFSPEDPAWTRTANATRIHNLGGTVGAWFADVTLYFFGYLAYLLPLGVVFAGWRLFRRGALLELDAEIVLFRVLGFAVTLTTACGLGALHLQATPGTVPGAGSAGGLVGVHVSQFLIHAFEFRWGNLFMAALLLAGVTLTTGFSWLKLLDWVGGAALKAADGIGGLIRIPPRRRTPPAVTAGGDARPDTAVPAAPATDSDKGSGAGMASRAAAWLRSAVTGLPAWWRTRRVNAAAENSPAPAEPGGAPPPPAAIEAVASAGAGRGSGRIEPVLSLPLERERRGATGRIPESPVVAPDPPGAALPDRTLIPVSAASPLAVGRPAAPPPPPPSVKPSMAAVPSPWVADSAFTARASNDSVGPKAPPPPPARIQPSAPTVAAPPESFEFNLLPSLDLLDRPPPRTAGYSPETLDEMSRQVESLLKSFGIDARVVAVEPGPVITRFEVDPAPGVKVSQISNLAKDLARGLSVISVRVVEVIPGKSVIGLEIPNRRREIVYLREVLEAPVYAQSAAPLTLALGMDIGGNPVVANLARMPHLLVAGTTGSGKSVAINAMLLSLLYKAPPAEVRLILVDPKMLELSMYEDIPHLLTPVVTDMKEAANALRWCVGEMERRYRLMAALKVRNIAGFNRKVLDALEAGEGLTDPFWKPDGTATPGASPVLQPLPFVVVVIDELADMMMIVGKKVEELIARLAQKARAAGIHLILATQRPSVDVITGLIKANIPTRIAFQVSAKVDSRTILDQMGAENLLGHGDMLYLPPGTGLPQRVHGAFVDDQEVSRVVDWLRRTGAPDYIDDVLAEPREDGDGGESEDSGRGGESDPLYDEAVRIVTESRRASVSGVQRRLRIGYNRAARLVEEMEVAGVVGPLQSNGSREVLAPPPP